MASKDRLLFKILVPVFSLILLFILFEIFLRIFQYDPFKSIVEEKGKKHIFLKQSSNKFIRYELNPGYQGKITRSQVRINSHGFRGREYDVDKGNKFRICILGDSVTFAINLEEKDTYPMRLEKYFLRDSYPVEVLNFAVEGYDTLQEVKHFERNGLKFSPDLVIVAYCLNDIGITPLPFEDIKRFVSLKKSFRVVQFIQLKLNKLKLINNLRKEMKSIRGFGGPFSELDHTYGEDPVIQNHIQQIQEILRKQKYSLRLKKYTSHKRIGKINYSFLHLKKMADKFRFKVIVMIFPFLKKNKDHYLFSNAHAIIQHEAKKSHFLVLDMYESLDNYGFKKVSKDGVHLNATGHKKVAQTLFEKLKPIIRLLMGSGLNGLLPNSCF